MASKRPYNKISGDETEQSEEGQNSAKINCPNDNSSSSSQQEVETLPEYINKMPDVAGHEGRKKGNEAGHGNRFQSKLLILYALRAIKLGYQFYLGTELPVGEKFDDLIFHYKERNDNNYRQQYLQAKHRLNDNDPKYQITANDLLDVKNGDFSLLKYFQSFVKIRRKGNDIENCIICTNVDFNHKNIKEKGITLEHVDELTWPKLLNCKDMKYDQTCYKFKDPGIFEFSILNAFFGNILNCVTNCKGEQMKSFYENCTEVVNGKPFNEHTAGEMKKFFSNCKNKNQVVKKLVEIVFDDFLDKMIFAVKTPNESELDDVLTKAVGDYFKLTNAALQSAHFMNEMVNWFKLTDIKHLWLTAEEAKKILNAKTDAHIKVIELTSLSLDYQKKLKQIKISENSELEFEGTAIDELTAMLQLFLDSQEKIKHVSSKTPKLTAVKVLSAIKKLPEFPNQDDYLVISSKRLKENQKEIKESLKTNINNGHRLLIVVNKEEGNPLEDMYYLKFIPETIKRKMIVISNQNGRKELYQDTITYGQLHENTKKVLEDKQVSFQGHDLTVNRLIDMKQVNEAEKILDSQLIENLLKMAEDNKIVVPSFNTFSIRKYIERKLKFPIKDQLFIKLADIAEKNGKKIHEEIEIDQNGNIKWKTDDDERKQKIWKELKFLLEQNNSSDLSLLSTVKESELIDTSNKELSTRIIITDVAGTGKSTILSHYYEEIKKANSDKLVIKISLMNYSKALMNEKSINEFLINNVIGQNEFAHSLLKHRLETGDRIILMLDGFDEINSDCQDKIIRLVKDLNESIPLYITTRPHLADKLQFELSQLAYRLDRFEEKNQIKYLTSIWKEFINLKEKTNKNYNEETIKTFARQLIDRISETLKDKEKEFIGIPLQCRILAECFQSKIKNEIIQEPNADLSHLIGDQQFDLVHLYKSLIDEKRRVFRQEKVEENSREGHIAKKSIENTINKTERHLLKLALQLIVNNQKEVDILIPVGFQSESERKTDEEEFNEFGIRFGFVDDKDENGIQFLHRTFAEYLVADFIFNGFLLGDDQHNNLLENESVRKWIIKKMLVEDNYEGVRVFFDSMLKEIILKEEWKSRIQNNDLPRHLQQFTNSFFSLRIRIQALGQAFTEMNSNISLLIFDCLDVMVRKTQSEIPSVINHSLRIEIINPFFIFRQRIDVFDRFFNYFDNAVDDELILHLTFQLNEENKQIENKKLERFLAFVKRHVDVDWKFNQLTVFFLRSKMEEQTRKQFFEILTSKYLKDFALILLIKNAISTSLKKYDCQIGKIEKVLVILRDLERIEVAADLSRFVIFREFETLKKEENANIRLLLEKMGMTELHWAAFEGNMSLIEIEIGCSLENPENCSEEEMKSVVQLMTDEEDSVPPLYLAVAYGHDDICKKIFHFLDLKKEISDEKGFFHRSLKDAITYENVVMVQTILTCVKEILGQNNLVKLLQSVIHNIDFYLNKMLVETITSVFVQDKENGCRDLSDLFFYNWSTLRILEHVKCDVLQKLISAAGGLDNWIKRLIDTDLDGAFWVLSFDGFLDKLNQENQISKLIDILITKSTLDVNQPSEPSTSYWSDFVKKTSWSSRKFLGAISKCLSEEDLKRLLLNRDDNNILILLVYLIRKGRNEFNYILSPLPENIRKEIEDLSEEEKPKLIDHFFSIPTFLELLDCSEQLNAIEYYLENGNEKQLAKFCQVLQVNQLVNIIISEEEKGKKVAGLLKEKLDGQTVIKYKKFIEKYSS